MQAITNKPDILNVLKAEGIELKQKGRHFWGLCPLHSERTASFCVDTEKQRFKCFGCGVSGDVIEVIVKLKNISFRDAVQYLRLSKSEQTSKKESRRRELVNKFREWCFNYGKWLCEMLRLCNRIDALVRTPEQLEIEGLAEMYLMRDIYKHRLSLLNGRNEELKFKLYEEFYGRN